MALPPEFNDVENFQEVVRRYINKQLREDFKDLHDANGNWEPDVTTTRSKMLKALRHEDTDSLILTVGKMNLYYFTYGGAKAMQPDIVGDTLISLDQKRKYRPQLTLFFSNGRQYNPDKKNDVVDGEISFRLMNETATTITQIEVNKFAAKVKSLFAVPKFKWQKGRTLVSYTDWDKGYQLALLVTNETEAKRIIEQVLDIQTHTPDWEKLNIKENSDPTGTYPTIPGKETILGKSVDKPKKRPVEDVYFRYSTLLLSGRGRAITLVDTTFTKKNPIERGA